MARAPIPIAVPSGPAQLGVTIVEHLRAVTEVVELERHGEELNGEFVNAEFGYGGCAERKLIEAQREQKVVEEDLDKHVGAVEVL